MRIVSTKTLVALLISLCLLPILSLETKAQTQQEVEMERDVKVNDVEGLRIDLKQYTQDPASKRAKFEMVLFPSVNSDRVKVTWEISGKSSSPKIDEMTTYLHVQTPTGKKSKTKITYTLTYDAYGKTLLVYGANSEFKVVSGNTYLLEVYVLPTGYGLSELVGKAEAFRAQGNLVVSASKLFGSNKYAEILPLTDDYKNAKTFLLIKRIVMYFGGTLLALTLAFFGFKRFVKWLNRDDVSEYERKSSMRK